MEGYMLEGMGSWISFVVLAIACLVGIWYLPSKANADTFSTFFKILMTIIIMPIAYIIVGWQENKS